MGRDWMGWDGSKEQEICNCYAMHCLRLRLEITEDGAHQRHPPTAPSNDLNTRNG